MALRHRARMRGRTAGPLSRRVLGGPAGHGCPCLADVCVHATGHPGEGQRATGAPVTACASPFPEGCA